MAGIEISRAGNTLTEYTVGGMSEIMTNIGFRNLQEAWIVIPDEGPEYTPTGTIDVDSVSTLDANLIDSNFNSLCYNNSMTGSTNLNFVGIDLGVNQQVSSVDFFWYLATYIGDFKIQYSTDGVVWNDATSTIVGVWEGASSIAQKIPFPTVTARYLRAFVLNGANPTFFILTQMKAFGAATTSTTQNIASGHDLFIELTEVNGLVKIKNNTSLALTFKIIS